LYSPALKRLCIFPEPRKKADRANNISLRIVGKAFKENEIITRQQCINKTIMNPI